MKFIFCVTLVLLLAGCQTGHIMDGANFNSGNVDLIKKGKTTSGELEQSIGTPLYREIVDAHSEIWKYYFVDQKIVDYVATTKLMTYKKTLQVFITDGVVENYTFASFNLPNKIQSSNKIILQ